MSDDETDLSCGEAEPDSESTVTPYILLLEDSPGEAELFCLAMVAVWESLESLSQSVRPWIDVQHTATEALHALRVQAGSGAHALPKLLVLDLDLPGRAGLAFLHALRQDPGLRNLPVIVMAWSEEEAMVRSLYELGVSAYVIKPMFFADLLTLAGQLCCNFLPGRSAPEFCHQDRVAHT